MYPKFIEVTRRESNEIWKSSIHIAQIVFFEDHTVWCTSSDVDENNGMILVEESYDELKALITDCGCLIHKADPRLDLTHPLTLDDLQSMIGEPVWNSNIDVWMLVKDVSDTWVKMLWTSGNISEYTEDELISYPVYRMRQ